MVLLVLSSGGAIMREIPRVWIRLHHIFPITAAAGLVWHGQVSALFSVALYILDRLFGYVNQAHVSHRESKTKCVAHIVDCEESLVRLSLPKIFNYKPGKYAGVCVPKVSMLEWHN